MKILVLSDLHLELGTSLTLPPALRADTDNACDAYDAVVLAGDIHSPGHKAVHWAQRSSTFGGKPVVLVPGNHEFYGRLMPAELARMKEVAAGSNVYLPGRASVVIDGVRFLGCTLWTDFQLPVRQPSGLLEVDVARALLEANRCMNDFRLIEVLSPSKNRLRFPEPARLLQASDTLAMHWTDRDWLRRQLAEPFYGLSGLSGPTVVVTHHAPSLGSVAERYAADGLTPAFVSHLPDDFFAVPRLWVHGHTHTGFDYLRGRCRVVSNPRGYRLRDSSFENPAFDPALVIEVASHTTLPSNHAAQSSLKTVVAEYQGEFLASEKGVQTTYEPYRQV